MAAHFNKLLDTLRGYDQKHRVNKALLETALRERGFGDIVKNITNVVEDEFPACAEFEEDKTGFSQSHCILKQHPLLLEDIILTLSRYLDFENLIAARMVHPSWNTSIMTKRYLQKTKLVIRFVDWDFWEFKKLIDAFPLENHERVKVPATVSLPNLGFITEPEPLTTWFRVYGPRFTRMEIGEDEDDWDELDANLTFRRSIALIRWLTELLPNLQELQIDNFELRGRLFKNDIQAVPITSKLKLLEIGCGDRRSLGDYQSIKQFVEWTGSNLETLRLWLRPKQQFQFLNICFETGLLMNLIALDLSEYKLSFQTLQLLATVDFKNLKKFVFKLETKKRDELQVCDEFSRLLDNVKDKLEDLTGGLAGDLFRFPEMQKLKKLECYVYDSAHTRSIELLALAPKLESLTLEAAKDLGIGGHELIFQRLFPPTLRFQNNSLKKLNLSNFPFDQSAFERLTTSLPAIEILSIGCYNRQIFVVKTWSLGQIFKDLGNLKRLVELSMSFQKTLGWSRKEELEFNQGISHGFATLKSLKKCSMDLGNRFPITGVAFREGFLKSASLQRLELRKFIIGSEIRPELELLRNKNVEVELLEWFCSQEDIWPVIYCK